MKYSIELYNYIINTLKFNTKESFEEFVIKNRLILILKNQLPKEYREMYNNMTKSNKTILKVFIEQYFELNRYLEQENIIGIFVKGITLSYLIYDDPLDRCFRDIDLYIHINHLNKFLDFLGSSGFTDSDKNLVHPSKIGGYYHRSHLKPFEKLIYVNNTEIVIYLEVHIIPFYLNVRYPGLHSDDFYNLFYQNIKNIRIGNTAIPTLEYEIYFLFLIDHFIKHLFHDLTNVDIDFNIDSSFDINMKQIYEIKVFFEKYKHNISIKKLLKLVKTIGMQHQFNLTLKYLNEVFSDSTIDLKANVNKLDKMKLIENKMCIEFSKFTLKDLFLDKTEFKTCVYNLLHNRDLFAGCQLNIQRKSTWSIGKEFIIDELNPFNKYRTHFKDGINKPNNSNENSFSGNLQWDNNFLHVNLMILDNNYPVNEHGKSFSILFDSSGIFKDSTATIKGLIVRVFVINMDTNDIGFEAIIIEGDYIINITENYICSFATYNNVGISAYIALPWEIIGIKPDVGVEFGMDISTIRYNNEHECESLLSISDICENYNQKFYAKAVLIDNDIG